jgi:hypothetical protein
MTDAAAGRTSGRTIEPTLRRREIKPQRGTWREAPAVAGQTEPVSADSSHVGCLKEMAGVGAFQQRGRRRLVMSRSGSTGRTVVARQLSADPSTLTEPATPPTPRSTRAIAPARRRPRAIDNRTPAGACGRVPGEGVRRARSASHRPTVSGHSVGAQLEGSTTASHRSPPSRLAGDRSFRHRALPSATVFGCR